MTENAVGGEGGVDQRGHEPNAGIDIDSQDCDKRREVGVYCAGLV